MRDRASDGGGPRGRRRRTTSGGPEAGSGDAQGAVTVTSDLHGADLAGVIGVRHDRCDKCEV